MNNYESVLETMMDFADAELAEEIHIEVACVQKLGIRLDAADALAADADTAILAMYAAQTCIWELHDTDNRVTRDLQEAIDSLDATLRQYREAK